MVNQIMSNLYRIRVFLAGWLFFFSLTAGAQNESLQDLRPEIDSIVERLLQSGDVVIAHCGDDPDVIFNAYRDLVASATKEELLGLCRHQDVRIRAYAVSGLKEREIPISLQLVRNYFTDTACVEIVRKCYMIFEGSLDTCSSVADATIEQFRRQAEVPETEMKILDSLVIMLPYKLSSRWNILYSIAPRQGLYNRIREIYLAEADRIALIALSKFRNEQDLPLIRHCLDSASIYTAFGAISFFPHPEFYPQLEEYLYKKTLISWERAALYSAVAAYRSSASASDLSGELKELRKQKGNKHRLHSLFKAVEPHLIREYENLFFGLWESGFVSSEVFQHLLEKYPEKVFRQALRSLSDPDRLNQHSNGVYDIKGYQVLSDMLELILKKDISKGKTIIRENLSDCNIHVLKIFAAYAGRIRDTSFIPPLLERAGRENFSILAVIDAVLAYNDGAIDQELKKIIETRKGTYYGDIALKYLTEKGI